MKPDVDFDVPSVLLLIPAHLSFFLLSIVTMSPPYSEENVPKNAPEHCPVSTATTTTAIEALDSISFY